MLSYNKKKNVLEQDDCIDKNVVSKKANFIVVKYEKKKIYYVYWKSRK